MTAAPACPRCGYDQSGVVASWGSAGACPLEGVCSECGLAFRWVDIFRPDRERLRGFFEHANTAVRSVGWAFTTLWWTVRPWVFWRRVTLFIRPVIARMMWWPVLLLLLTHVLGSLLETANVVIQEWVWAGARGGSDWTAFVNCWTLPLVRFEIGGWWGGLVIIRDPYGALPIGLGFLISAAAWPLMLLLLGESLRAGKIRAVHILRAAVYSLAWIVYLEVMGALDSAARLAQTAGAALMGAGPFGTPWFSNAVGWINAILGLSLVPWLLAWWWFAINRGFRLRHGWWVWALLMVASMLAGVLAAVLTALCGAGRYLG